MNSSKNIKPLNKLKKIRKEKKLTSKAMAEKLEISKAFYSQIENGTRKLSYDTAIKISIIFNSKPDKIFYDDFKTI